MRPRNWNTYEDLLPMKLFRNLAVPIATEEFAYFTLPEARQLNLFVEEVVDWLDTLTRQGYFLVFDAKRGRLTCNPSSPDECKLDRSFALEKGVRLPEWVYSTAKHVLTAQCITKDSMIPIFSRKEVQRKEQAKHRHSSKGRRAIVHYDPKLHSANTVSFLIKILLARKETYAGPA